VRLFSFSLTIARRSPDDTPVVTIVEGGGSSCRVVGDRTGAVALPQASQWAIFERPLAPASASLASKDLDERPWGEHGNPMPCCGRVVLGVSRDEILGFTGQGDLQKGLVIGIG